MLLKIPGIPLPPRKLARSELEMRMEKPARPNGVTTHLTSCCIVTCSSMKIPILRKPCHQCTNLALAGSRALAPHAKEVSETLTATKEPSEARDPPYLHLPTGGGM
ncbi:unnamed protein product [Pleuronectes platessa]|uniref:Uncharacterized protein n=1 Tax=Pleuronectes platessa TaxID=8262 RepID=A0A9N7YKU3_PLEPL|nr:unnamed protein product [Pleuronectes platessa]